MKKLLFLIAVFSHFTINGQKLTQIEFKFPGKNEADVISVEEFNDYYLYQSDMVIPKKICNHHNQKGLLSGSSGLWDCGVIPYTLDNSLSDITIFRIEEAIEQLNNLTNIQLIPRTTESNYVHFTDCSECNDGGFCRSFIGKIGGKQEIGLTNGGCGAWGVIAHEILHAAGFLHEQSRSDRNSFVDILENNIKSGFEGNFEPVSNGDDIGNYDYNSIMHYGSYAFSKNGQPTIVPNNGSAIGQRNQLSQGDINSVNQVYECGAITNNNDDCNGAKLITSCFTRVENNFNSSLSTNPPFSCASGNIRDVWFKINPIFNSLTLETRQINGGLNDLEMQVFTGSCDNLQEIACNDDGGSGNHAKVIIDELPNLNTI